MYKTYSSATIDQAAIDADPDLKNSAGNRFASCTFEGEIADVNFMGATFAASCDFTGGASPAEFLRCNMIDLGPEGGGVDPTDEGATFTLCSTGSLYREVERGAPAPRPPPIVPSIVATLAGIETGLTAGDYTPLRFFV